MLLGLDQVYTPFGLRNNKKGNWKRENTFWIKLGQSVYTGRVRYDTGRVRYERDYKNRAYPFGPNRLVSSKPTSWRSSSHLGWPRISPRKRREGDRVGEGLHQDWRPEDLEFSSPSHLFSQGTLITDLVRSTWSMHDFEIPSINMLHCPKFGIDPWWFESRNPS